MVICALFLTVGPADEPHSYLSRLISPENVPNIVLAIVGIVGIGVGICTLLFIKRQAQEMTTNGS